ncbi:hypothetical protein COCNU_05G004110 [Cocos nucifera]|uniref:Uncharacterized protein n=1 Tax=Cocos nucifera TaxID=13894 RepID=A0A8K0I7Z6_COCNU|nr:hypothetical protein COCNU_05G004110 [Cocos nucifera]
MKGLFKSKPRTPADVVRQTRDLLIYIDINWNTREAKREEKVPISSRGGEGEVAAAVLEGERRVNPNRIINVIVVVVIVTVISIFCAKELLTRHKSTVAEFLSKNYDWVELMETDSNQGSEFFNEFNSKLLESPNYITRRQAIKLLGDMLLDRSNSAVMMRYVSSKDNLMILMNLLRESSKNIQIEAFHVFKLFAANQYKPQEIVSILVTNKNKLLRLLGDFKTDKEDEQFDADKSQVIKEIAAL